ncbi:ExbD/TolR family protein [Falsiroseomonas selenitidurans]|uniref:Biopolymer transporter ExbD n=1 Tax=Falsiroseomonas selenitidurans TaxID=2716335 RepID=A0ABX1E806_9PROT|nr:biopolymer transporter ExbD [Falsiroseomonas selenitidurans]NKC33093.1 biopolymer transporter ExbD [Falsiroseomonas selenitidurans]
MAFGNLEEGDGEEDGVMSEINVTPFVDVMLVLLIVFMVAAPMMMVGVPVDLPRAPQAPVAQVTEPLVLTLDRQGRLYIEEAEADPATLAATLAPLAAAAPDRPVFVRADRGQEYGTVMRVLAAVAAAGFGRASLIGEAAP